MRSVRRTGAIVALGARRVVGRLVDGGGRRVLLSAAGVAIAITLMLVVSGIGLGLATQNTVYGSDVDYWITPESGSGSTMAVSVGSAQFGNVHPVSERLAANPDVETVSPILIEVVRLEHDETAEYVLLLGVAASPSLRVGGLSAQSLTAGDPYYANGTYDGDWTGEIVLSSAASTLLNASTGERVTVAGMRGGGNVSVDSRTFSVADVNTTGGGTGFQQAPVALVHLSELQTLTGLTGGDAADQFLVGTNSPAVKDDLEQVYPHSTVVSRSGFSVGSLSDSNMALAVAFTSFVVALVIGTLFVATTMGLEITASRREFATITSLGISWRSRALIVVTETLCVTLLGGVAGLLLGFASIWLVNTLAMQYLTPRPIALAHPLLAAYGLAVALLIGTLAAPYLLVLLKRAPLSDQMAGR